MIAGDVDPVLRAEFPELRLWWEPLEAGWERSTREVRDELARLSNRFGGAQAIALRQQPIPHAYRVFFRHLGLDPDERRPPGEAAAVERMRAGRFASHHLVADAATIALVHTGVPLYAIDGDAVRGALSLRVAGPGSRIAVADEHGPIAALFEPEIPPPYAMTKATRQVVLYTVQVAGVPSIHVEEAVDQVRAWVLGE